MGTNVARQAGTLIDDGTLDTVIQCAKCGHDERFDSFALLEGFEDEGRLDSPSEDADRIRRSRAFAMFDDEHECYCDECDCDDPTTLRSLAAECECTCH